MRNRVKGQGAAARFAALLFALCAFGPGSPAGFCQTYTTTFTGNENPLSEGGKWSNKGLDWDSTFKTGNPGIGEVLACPNGHGVGSNADFGFASFTARAIGQSPRGANAGSP